MVEGGNGSKEMRKVNREWKVFKSYIKSTFQVVLLSPSIFIRFLCSYGGLRELSALMAGSKDGKVWEANENVDRSRDVDKAKPIFRDYNTVGSE